MAIQRRRTASKGKKPERTGLGGGSVDRHLSRPRSKRPSNYISVGDGNTITVRAVDPAELFADGDVHPVEFKRKDGSTYTLDRLCLDVDDEGTPCPGCRDDLDRRYKFWMVVIVRDAEQKNKSGKVIGTADQVKILSGATRLVKGINAKAKRRDLSKRDLEISQDGESFDVQYEVEWATDEDDPLSVADKKLIKSEAAQKVIEAFKTYTTPTDEEDFYEAQDFKDDDDDEPSESARRRGSVFNKDRKKGASTARRRVEEDDDDEDEDDDEDDKPLRRRSSGVKRSSTTAKPKGALARRSTTTKSTSTTRSKSSGGILKKRK